MEMTLGVWRFETLSTKKSVAIAERSKAIVFNDTNFFLVELGGFQQSTSL
jgi:hypothetical protein